MVVGKLDSKKASDHVNWDFHVLELMAGSNEGGGLNSVLPRGGVLYLVYLGNIREVPTPMEEVQKDNSEMVNEAAQDYS